MPRFAIIIQKSAQGRKWTNRYFIEGTSPSDLTDEAMAIVTAERAVTATFITFDGYRISDLVPGSDIYTTAMLNLAGSRVITDGINVLLPLNTTLVVDLNVLNGRPSRKFLRGALIENEVTNFNDIAPARLTEVLNSYITPVLSVVGICDVDGQAFSSGTVKPKVGIRQWSKRSKRKDPIPPPPAP